MSRFEYPDAERLDIVEQLHGRPVADPYRWLEDPSDPRTETWEAAQDALLTDERVNWTLREHFGERLAALMASGDVSAPSWRGERQFFLRRLPEQQHAVYVTVDPDGAERVLIDPMALDPSGTTTLDGVFPSKEGDLLAYLISESGTEESSLYVLDVATGERVEGPISRTRYSPLSWLPGGKAYYYVRRLAPDEVPEGQSQYHRRARLHEVGANPDTDREIFGTGQPMTNYYWTSVTRSGRWLALYASPGTAARNDVWVADLTASDPAAPELTPVQVGVDAQATLTFGAAETPLDGKVLVHTDLDAPRSRICVVDAADLGAGAEAWRTLVAEDREAVLNGFEVLDGPGGRPLLAVSWTRHAVAELTLHDAQTGEQVGEIPLPGLGSVGELVTRPEGGGELWFTYSDFTTPGQVHRYDAATGETALWAAAPGRIEVPKVRTRQVTYRSKDGTEVRMFVMDDGRDGAESGPRPTILYGYGGFNISQSPAYSARILAWVEAGGVYAVANLRGGSEEGEEWHRAGMMENKQNVFDDYHAAGDWLVANGVTTREQLGIFGGSNGGLLVGVALTQHPEKYAAVVCWAPLLDMVRYERFGLGVTWNEEYGTAEDPEQLGWLLSYSPYHAVTAGTDYPATLFTVFDGDTRVDPLHARKLAAQLQHATSGDRPILYRIEREAGHGARAVSRTVGVYAEMWAFLAARLGLGPGADRK